MPFKTKRQKISASQRRFTFEGAAEINYPSNVKAIKNPAIKITSTKTDSKSIENLDYVRSDIVKILSGASVIILAQLGFSLTLA